MHEELIFCDVKVVFEINLLVAVELVFFDGELAGHIVGIVHKHPKPD